MNKQKINKIITPLLFLLVITSCRNNTDSSQSSHHKEVENVVELTQEQVTTVNLKLGKIEMKNLSSAIKVNGILDVPPQNLVTISAPMGGFVKNTELLQGMKVHKGQVLIVMQHPDYVQIQQDFLESKSQLEFLELDYKRQLELQKENVNAQKTVQQAKSNYESMLAKNSGLKQKLGMIGINADNLNGKNIQSTISITSPINGFVTVVNVNIGKHVNSTDVLFKIVDTEHLHAELVVFEKDIQKVKTGQRVRFSLANETEVRTATVYLIGKEIGNDRTVRVHCHLDKEDASLLPGTYLSAFIEAGAQNVSALPNAAIVSFEGKDYVFVAEKETNHFRMVEVKKGVSELDYTEVSFEGELSLDQKIVINGAYDILAKLKNSEEEEE